MKQNGIELDDGFFRREAGRMLAALTRVFGVHNLALAEDVVQETLTNAFEVWSHRGEVPKHAGALLMTSAKNRAIDVFRRERTARKFAPEIGRMAESEWTLRPVVEELFLPEALKDDELRMMFSCCEPRIAEDVQVSLILNVLCGFTVHELASAFLITEAAMEKRLSRGKKALAESTRLFELTAEDFAPRLSSVHRALYLLFNEGYHGASTARAVRKDLCREAMRLVRLLCDHAPAATPETQALAALMFLNAARLDTRIDEEGNLTSLAEQDRSRWDRKLIAEGLRLLDASATGDALTEVHVEAGIASLHASAPSLAETNWKEVVTLYDMLMKINPSPVVALNRAVAIGEALGPDAGLAALDAITDTDVARLLPYPFYEATRGELELRRGHLQSARKHFEEARKRARNDSERRFLDQRIAQIV
jgi:predicted RNA polymerase sigma factor